MFSGGSKGNIGKKRVNKYGLTNVVVAAGCWNSGMNIHFFYDCDFLNFSLLNVFTYFIHYTCADH